MRLANRFFLAAAAVLIVAYFAARFLPRLDATGAVVEFAVLGGILLLLWPVARLLARRIERELGEAREAVDRIASGDLGPSPGASGSDSVGSLGQAIGRMAE